MLSVRRGLQELFVVFFKWLVRRDLLPLNRNFGRDRGLPVGRRYLDEFLSSHAHRVKGRCLEFGDPRYRHLFGHADAYEVFSMNPGPDVDHVGDIHELPMGLRGRYDWIICTQVLEHVRRPDLAAAQLFALLKPGGGLLFSVPFFNVVHPDPRDFRRFTADGARVTLEDAGFVVEELAARGNFAISVGALMGLSGADFPPSAWVEDDPDFPYIITALARRPPTCGDAGVATPSPDPRPARGSEPPAES